jgi:hypothetical protein
MPMPEIQVKLAISAERFQVYYSGRVRHVIAKAADGRRVQFPAKLLQQFLSHNGVHGTFVISYGEDGRQQSIRRLDGK